jgi:hypothetical protein
MMSHSASTMDWYLAGSSSRISAFSRSAYTRLPLVNHTAIVAGAVVYILSSRRERARFLYEDNSSFVG